MRIAFLTHQWPGIRMGGIGSAVQQTAAALAGAGHDVHVFTLAIPEDVRSSIPAGVHFHESADLAMRVQRGDLPSNLAAMIDSAGEGAYRLALAWLLCGALQKEHAHHPFDIVEAPEVEALALPLMLNADFSAPIVTHLHCCTALAHFGNQSTGEQPNSLAAELEFAAIHLADALCAPTCAVVRGSQKFTPIAQSVAILPHPYKCAQTQFKPPPADGPMLFIGRLEYLKGVTTITHALNLFLPRHPQAIFRFIGPDTSTAPTGGSMRQHLQSLLSPSISPRVHFAGELSSTHIERELHTCSFVVQPSFCENFSLACCEALAAGRTVIVGQQTGSVELVGNTGVEVDPENPSSLAGAMEHLWSNRSLLHRLSQAAHTRISKQFSPAEIAPRRAAFYQQAIENFRQQRRSLPRKLATLPPSIAAAVLPALCNLTGALAGVHQSIQSPGVRLLGIMDNLSRSTGQPARVLLYGAGKFTARLLAQRALWEARGHRVVGLIDDHSRFVENPTYLDLPVQSIDAAASQVNAGLSLLPIVLSTDTYEDQFWSKTQPLRTVGVPVIRLSKAA